MNKIDNYINEVLNNIVADKNMKERIRNDLFLHLNELSSEGNIDDILTRMGDPKEVAKEFMDTIYDDKSEIIEKLIQERTKVNILMNGYYEYKSKAKLFGLPLVHIKLNRRSGKPCVAKGIVAIGTVSIGVLSIGALPIGLISLGGFAVGAVSFGGVSIGLLLALGGLAVGSLAVGGFAVGLGAIGGCVIGKIAIGGYAKGTVAIGSTAVGKYIMTTQHIGPDTKEAVYGLIKNAYPNLPDWIVNFFSSLNIKFH
ncbi:MAG: hypothetical protein Q8942_18735 [Bacillota bacterium]|nr:hypothetical protein [Bacillota bacterium]